MPATGGEPQELYRFEKEERLGPSITWTADGKYILFAMKNRKIYAKWELCRIPSEGGEPEKLGLEMGRVFNFSVHPDRRHIAFSSLEQESAEVWVMENFLPE